jgi:uncharacterized ferredoxin-like protein
MYINSQDAEKQAVLNLAYSICAAARTAPKARGIDHTDTAILTGDDKQKIVSEMRKMGDQHSSPVFLRDAGNVEKSEAVVLIGAKRETRGLNGSCKLCGFSDCGECSAKGAVCVFTSMDLGIALGSAVAMAADNRIDNRMMFTIGKAAASLGFLGQYNIIIGIPLSVSGKSVFFDRA